MPRAKAKLNLGGILVLGGVLCICGSLLDGMVDTGRFAVAALLGRLGILGFSGVAAGVILHVVRNPEGSRRFLEDHCLLLAFLGSTGLVLLLPDRALVAIPLVGGLEEWIGRVVLLVLLEGAAVLAFVLLVRRFRVEFSDRTAALGNSVVLVQISIGLLVAVNVLGANQISKGLGIYDATETGAHTLSDETLSILSGLEDHPGTLRVTYFCFDSDVPLGGRVRDLLRRYDGASAYLSVKEIKANIDLSGKAKRLRELGLAELDLRNLDAVLFTYHESDDEGATPRMLVVEVLRSTLVEPGLGSLKFMGEQVFTSAIREVLFPKRKVYFLTGHREASLRRDLDGDQSLSRAGDLIERLALEADSLSLMDQPRVPEDAAVVVIAGPRSPLEPGEKAALVRYLDAGGALILTLDPQISLLEDGGEAATFGLEDYLASLGIEPRPDFILMDYERAVFSASGAARLEFSVQVLTTSFGRHASVKRLEGRKIPCKFYQACPIQIKRTGRRGPFTEVATDALVDMRLELPREWRAGNRKTYAAKLYRGRNVKGWDPERDLRGRLHVAVAAEKRRRLQGGGLSEEAQDVVTRVVVIGDSVFMRDLGLDPKSGHHALGNGIFFSNVIAWAAARESLISIDPKIWETEQVTLLKRESRLALAVGVIAIPLLVLLLGVSIAWTRRR